MVATPKEGEDPKPGETKPKEPLENEAKPTETPAEEKPEGQDVTKLQADLKEARKQAMRANQLENQLSEANKKLEDKERRELEEKEDFKSLAEQEKAKREELEATIEERDRKTALRKAEQGVLDDYSDDLKSLVKDAGIKLADITEEAVAEFKGKLDKMNERLSSSSPTPNNPHRPSGKKKYTREQLYDIMRDPVKRDAYYRENYPLTAEMMDSPKA